MENIRIKTSPQALYAGASDVHGAVTAIRNHFSNIEAAVNRSSGYWQGDAANAHRAAYKEMKGTVDEILARLSEHAEDLESMAQVYLGVEEETKAQSKDLPSDVIL